MSSFFPGRVGPKWKEECDKIDFLLRFRIETGWNPVLKWIEML